MAQKKGRSDKSTKDASPEGSALILDYLRKQDRPYSAIDISTNLHNRVTKPYAVKTLRELHQKKEIECRVAGKQVVYHALQEELNEAGPDVVAAMDEEIQILQEQLPSLKENDKKMQGELNAINTLPFPPELRTEIAKLEKEKGSIAAHLAKMQGDGAAHVSPLDKENVRKDWKLWQNRARLRVQICRDIWRKCSETLPENMTREELWEGLGLEGTPM